ncbi:MAG: glycosyltransferase family 2 protein [Ignavibacteria bacterium]|nr:glycosyltransferase family 2 protein [Ignavibacteria bacterium]
MYQNQQKNIDVSIIIVSWNTKKLLENCINSIYNETKKYSFEIIVVDNDSPDNSAGMVKEFFPDVVLIANKTNNGFAPANNQGIKIAKGENILLLNPDTVVINNAIDKMLDYLYSHKNDKIGIITCKLLNDDMTLQKSVNDFFNIWRSFFENRFFAEFFSKLNTKKSFMSFWDHSETREIDWAYGAVLLYTREVADKVGMLDDRFWIYAEEMDFYIRVKRAGYKSIFLHDVEIIHYGKSSSRQRRAAMFIQNYKSFYLFLKKHYSYLTYLTYRFRTYIYMILWIIKYSLTFIIHKIKGKDSSEDKNQIEIYFKTFIWHFTKDSFVKLK